MKTTATAAGPHGTRRSGPALALSALLAFGAFGAAGELAVLHSVLAEDVAGGVDGGLVPCKAPGGLLCAPDAQRPAGPSAPTVSRIGVEMVPALLGGPAFTAIFEADGTFTYVGEANAERLGEHTGRVDVGALHQVMRLAEVVAFESLADTYASPFLDNPTSYVMVEWPRTTKVVRADAGVEPPVFWALRELLVGLLQTAEWDD